ncbi:MAG: BatD family protein, partial [Sedimentisphaerales bacterium]|nr:BatD family protein [Sedimentisphaerales bacterium]
LAVGRVRSRSPFDDFGFFGSQKQYKRYAVTAKPLKLTVSVLPDEGRPAGFYGLVGRYTIEASASPTKVSVGDPITLTIKIGGSRYLKPVQWPALEEVEELTRDFKLPSQKASPAVEEGLKTFVQTIRANNDKVDHVPPIPLSYFDADQGKYIVAQTAPIALEVAPTKILTNTDLEGTDGGQVNRQVEAIKEGLSANYEGPDALTNQRFSPLAAAVHPGYLTIWAVPLAVLIISSLVKFFTRTSPEQVARRRRRLAKSKALKQLSTIAEIDARQRQELLVSAMKQYIGDRFDRVAGSLTADDCCEIVASATNDAQIAAKFKDTIAACEASRYSSARADLDAGRIDEVAGLIRTIEKKSR